MTIDRASVEEGARLAAEAHKGPWTWEKKLPSHTRERWLLDGGGNCIADVDYQVKPEDAAFIAHWNPEFAAELARDWLRMTEALEAIERDDLVDSNEEVFAVPAVRRMRGIARAVLANQAAEEE